LNIEGGGLLLILDLFIIKAYNWIRGGGIYMNNFNSLAGTIQGTATVGTTSTEVLPINADRTYAVLINYGSVDITLGLEAEAVLNKGIILPANGGFYEMSGQYGNNVRGIISAIADTTATVINYMASKGGA